MIDGVGAQIGELFRLEAAPNLLDGIDFRCVAREWLDGQPVPLAVDPGAHPMAALRRQSLPDEDQPPPLDLVQLPHALYPHIAAIGAPKPFSDEALSPSNPFAPP